MFYVSESLENDVDNFVTQSEYIYIPKIILELRLVWLTKREAIWQKTNIVKIGCIFSLTQNSIKQCCK